CIGLRLGIGRALHHALIGMLVVGLQMLLPAPCEKRIELGPGGARRMDVAVGDRGLCILRCCLLGKVAELHVHGVVSLATSWLRRPYVAKGLSIMILRTRSDDKPLGSTSLPSNCQCG